jgi:Right handed beta helix region
MTIPLGTRPAATRGRVFAVLFVAAAIGVALVRREQWLAAWPAPQQVSVGVQDNIQAKVDASPPGTTFLIAAGVHRLQSIVPKSADSFVGEQGSVLSGAAQLTSFQPDGGYWVARVPVQLSATADQQAAARSKCQADHPACGFPEDLFIDDVPLQRVLDQSGLAPGKWYLDYGSGNAYLGDDPTGHRVEISVTRHAFSGSAADVTIRGLVVEKYANPAQTGAVHSLGDPGPCGHHWTIEKNEMRFNHGGGVKLCDTKLTDNNIHHNGQIGVIGVGNDELVEGNQIAGNNYAGYDYRWEGGGTKFAELHNLVVRDNDVHDNKGPGLWTDSNNFNVLYEHNHTSNNLVAGIAHEVSFDAVIRNNTIENDGYDPHASPWYGAGIDITGSSNVEIYGNTITNCMNGIIAKQPQRGSSRTGRPYVVKNIYVHDNTITQAQGIALGLLKSGSSDDQIFASSNNRFENNSFKLANPSGRYFIWQNKPRTLAEWKSLAGHGRATRE